LSIRVNGRSRSYGQVATAAVGIGDRDRVTGATTELARSTVTHVRTGIRYVRLFSRASPHG